MKIDNKTYESGNVLVNGGGEGNVVLQAGNLCETAFEWAVENDEVPVKLSLTKTEALRLAFKLVKVAFTNKG